jgi:hypothetical protein
MQVRGLGEPDKTPAFLRLDMTPDPATVRMCAGRRFATGGGGDGEGDGAGDPG